MRVAWIVLALGVAACGKTDSGESMASAGNALTPEQVDAALGPEPEEKSAPPEVRNRPQPAETLDPAEEDTMEPTE